jgi:hypothetical protein
MNRVFICARLVCIKILTKINDGEAFDGRICGSPAFLGPVTGPRKLARKPEGRSFYCIANVVSVMVKVKQSSPSTAIVRQRN